MNALFFGIMAYVVAQLIFGFAVSRHIHTESDYLVAGRRLGSLMCGFTVFATWFGAETCIGAAGVAYEGGLSATRADPFGYGVALIVMGVVFARALWKRKLLTLSDLMNQRYGSGVERLSVVVLVPTSILWAAAQIRAFGQILAASSDFSVSAMISIAAFVVIVYTTVGGLLADAISDLVQGAVLIVGLLVIGWMVYQNLDPAVVERTLTAERVRLVPQGESWLITLEVWSVPILGSLVAQELVARVIAAKNATVARRSAVLGGVAYLAIGMIPLSIGLLGPELVPGLRDSEQILIHVAQTTLPTWLVVVFVGALVSALLSTVDSALLVAGSLAAHNIVLRIVPVETERTRVRINRLAVVISGLCAYTIALSAEGVYHLVVEASSFGTAGVLVAVVFALFSRVGGAASAYASLLTGIISYIAGSKLFSVDTPYLLSFCCALFAYLIFAIPRYAAPSLVCKSFRSRRF